MEHSNSDDRLKEKIIEKMREKNSVSLVRDIEPIIRECYWGQAIGATLFARAQCSVEDALHELSLEEIAFIAVPEYGAVGTFGQNFILTDIVYKREANKTIGINIEISYDNKL